MTVLRHLLSVDLDAKEYLISYMCKNCHARCSPVVWTRTKSQHVGYIGYDYWIVVHKIRRHLVSWHIGTAVVVSHTLCSSTGRPFYKLTDCGIGQVLTPASWKLPNGFWWNLELPQKIARNAKFDFDSTTWVVWANTQFAEVRFLSWFVPHAQRSHRLTHFVGLYIIWRLFRAGCAVPVGVSLIRLPV